MKHIFTRMGFMALTTIALLLSSIRAHAQTSLLPQWDGFQRDIPSVHNNTSYFAQNGRPSIPLLKSISDPRVAIFSFDIFPMQEGLDSAELRVYNESSVTTNLVLYAKEHELADNVAPTWGALNLSESMGTEVATIAVSTSDQNSWLVFSGETLSRKLNETRLAGKKMALIVDYAGTSGPNMILQNSNGANVPTLSYTIRTNEPVTAITLDGLAEMQNNTSQILDVTIDPYYATLGTNLQWLSTDSSIATVVDGEVTGVSLGQATISASSGNVSTNFDVDVIAQINVQSISITTKPFSYISIQEVNQNFDQLEIDIQPSNAGNKNVIWASSNDSIATVSQNGTVIGKREGNVTITVTTEDGGLTASRNLTVNEVWPLILAEEGSPAAGKRVFVTPNEYTGTDAYYTLYLPDSWSPSSNTRYPVFVDFPGRGVRPENIKIGQVLAQKFQGIWLCLPLIYEDGTQEVNGWWANDTVTSDYVQSVVRSVCEQYNGNTERLFSVGMSRGAVATNYIGNYDDDISDMWRGYYSHDHIDGQRRIDGGEFPDLWTDDFPNNGSVEHNGFFIKFARINGRPYLISNSTVADVPEFLSGKPTKYSEGAFTDRDYLGINPDVPYHDIGQLTLIEPDVRRAIAGAPSTALHSSEILLSRLDDAQFVFSWFEDVMLSKIGVHSVSGIVTDINGSPVKGVMIEGGGVHFTFTDAAGRYEFEALPKGNRTVSISEKNNFNFSTAEQHINLTGDLTEVDFMLAGTVGIVEQMEVLKPLYFPNPGTAQIQFANEIERATIVSLKGQLVKTTSNQTMDVSELETGIYLIKLELKNGTITSQKLIIE